MNQKEILKILEDHYSSLKNESFKSYDLSDITSQNYFLKMNRWCHGKSIGKYVKYPHNLLVEYFTPLLRKYYGIEKRDFAQSNAFIVRGLCKLYQKTQDEYYLVEAKSIVKRISEQRSKGFKHACWGQPYDWFSKKIMPAYVPRTTVTSQVGKMFLEVYLTTKENKYLTEAIDIGDFFLEEMPLSYDQDNQTCFSYTTIDQHQVHNPNMMAAGFLSMLGHVTKEAKYQNRAITAGNFTFSAIRDDGSWYYSKLPNDQPSKIDNYHTGYNLEGGMLMSKYLGDQFKYEEELNNGIAYYLKHLFSPEGIPYLTNKKRYPIDIQCCAQSIITLSYLSEHDKKYKKRAKDLFEWTYNNMYEDGSYYYRISKNGSKDKTNYIRWGDAWMFYAGSLLPE